MKKLFSLILGLTLVSFLVGIVLVIMYAGLRPGQFSNDSEHEVRHRVIALLPETREHFNTELNRYLAELSLQRHIAIEFRPLIANAGPEELLHAVELAILSQPDGIFLQGYDSPALRSLIDLGVQKGLVIITLLADIHGTNRQSFVGYNAFAHGREVGRYLIASHKDPLSVGLILNRQNPSEPGPMEQGILAGLSAGLNLATAKRQVFVDHTISGTFTGEERIRSFLQMENRPQVLVCTTARDTIAAAQAILDQNLVGKVSVVGLDSSPEIRDYLDRGIVTISVLRNPEKLAQLALDAFLEYRETGRTSDYHEAGFQLWTGGEMP